MTAGGAPLFAAADWGTTRLRVWLMDGAGRVLAERRSDEGMLSAAPDRFAAILERRLQSMGAPEELPAIICGMAGARQGWIEAPYLTTPIALGEVLTGSVAVPHEKRRIRIIPGVAQRTDEAPDVMRGEETQLAGAPGLLKAGRRLVCLPGTHCKWAEVEDGTVKRFATWMTGELFSLLATSSILRHAVNADGGPAPDDPVFSRWALTALERPDDMTSLLFRIRAASLLQGLSPADAAATLSGLLIGAEIASARRRFGDGGKVALIASGALGDLYDKALRLAGIDAERMDAEEAVIAGLFQAGRRSFLSPGMEERAG